MKPSRMKLVLLPLLLAALACGPSVLQFGSSGGGADQATATQEPTSEATLPSPSATPTVPAEPAPTEPEPAMTIEPTPTDRPLEWPDGNYTVTHDEGSMVCPGVINEAIPAGNQTVVTLAWQNPGQSLQISGLEGQTMQFTLAESGAGGFSMVSEGVYGGVPMTHTLYFLYGIQWIEGTIQSELQGCTVNRSFTASPN